MTNINLSGLAEDRDHTVYIVLDDFGKIGRAYVETDEASADLESLIKAMLTGQYRAPVRVVAFNTAQGWSNDVSEDVCRRILARARRETLDLPSSIRDFVSWNLGQSS
jgi:hypothetical protein